MTHTEKKCLEDHLKSHYQIKAEGIKLYLRSITNQNRNPSQNHNSIGITEFSNVKEIPEKETKG